MLLQPTRRRSAHHHRHSSIIPLLLLLQLPLRVDAQSPTLAFSFNGNYYQYYAANAIAGDRTAAASFASGLTKCGVTGHLADITTPEEQEAIWNNVAPVNGASTPVWIGLNDVSAEGVYRLSDNSLATYFYWEATQPTGTVAESCTALQGTAGEWYDNDCSTASNVAALIEFNCPAPTATAYVAGHRYDYIAASTLSENWVTAATAATGMNRCGVNGHLATITSDQEFMYLWSQLGTAITASGNPWIGLNDRATNNVYVWDNGEPVVNYYWNAGEPNGGAAENCVEMTSSLLGKWNDADCTILKGILVEYDCPTPTAVGFYKNHRYEYYSPGLLPQRFIEASFAVSEMTYCGIPAHMADLTTAAELSSVVSLVPNAEIAWLGLNDRVNEGVYLWSNGVSPDVYGGYYNWGNGEPSGPTEDCVFLDPTVAKFCDYGCAQTNVGVLLEYDCPVTFYNTHYYLYYPPGALTAAANGWNQAATAATGIMNCGVTGHLADFADSTEYDAVFGQFALAEKTTSILTWIGANDIAVDGSFKNSDGTAVTFTRWNAGEPNNAGAGEDCVCLNYDSTWNDCQCSSAGLGSMVEFDCIPTSAPSASPSRSPSTSPSRSPSLSPTTIPSAIPSRLPSANPSGSPSRSPSRKPSSLPSRSPSRLPSRSPSRKPSSQPSRLPSTLPSQSPSRLPSRKPSQSPTRAPSVSPSISVKPSAIPSRTPSRRPSRTPSAYPTRVDYVKTFVDMCIRSMFVTAGCYCWDPLCVDAAMKESCRFTFEAPKDRRRYKKLLQSKMRRTCLDQLENRKRTLVPTYSPSVKPSFSPSARPTVHPTISLAPSISNVPSASPSFSESPSISSSPSNVPTRVPSRTPTQVPTFSPSTLPSQSRLPSFAPSKYSYNVKACLRDVLLTSQCGCGPDGLACFRNVNRDVCMTEYRLKNQLNTKDELETFAEKTRIAYDRECRLRRRRGISARAVICLSCG